MIVGILGGSAGTIFDAFQLIHDARKHGVRVALFGRKINLSERPLAFIEFLRQARALAIRNVALLKDVDTEAAQLLGIESLASWCCFPRFATAARKRSGLPRAPVAGCRFSLAPNARRCIRCQ